MRAQGGGHIVQVSSIGGVTAFPGLGIYHASKWALEGFSEALAQEVGPAGIKVSLIEPGGYATDWSGSSAAHSAPHPAYQPFRDATAPARAGVTPPRPDDTVAAILALVDAPAPPLRLLLSGLAYDLAQGTCTRRQQAWAEWEAISRQADGNAGIDISQLPRPPQ